VQRKRSVQQRPLVIREQCCGLRPGEQPGAMCDIVGTDTMYSEDVFELLTQSLGGFTHIVSSREGLFGLSLAGVMKIAEGRFFGLTVYDQAIYCFEALGPISTFWPHRGRIVRLQVNYGRIVSAEVVVKGLPNGCHQIDFIGKNLFICDTYNSRLFIIAEDFLSYSSFLPWGEIGFQDFVSGYPHVNSVVGFEGGTYLMLHRCSQRTGLKSQLVRWFRESGHVAVAKTIDGYSCHNIVFTEGGSLLTCDSDRGALSDGVRCIVTIGKMYTRGLSVDSEFVVVGCSLFSRRDSRSTTVGNVCFLDREYREVTRFVLPAATTDIRKIDGRDLSLTNSRLRKP